MKRYSKKALSVCLAAALLLSTLLGVWAPWGAVDVRAASEITNIEELGDWLHYNGIVFGSLYAYQADLEGAIAVGGSEARWGILHGYDAGASYNYYDTVHMGQYTNDDHYPTVLLGVDSLEVGSTSQVYGGPIVMSPELLAGHDAGGSKLVAGTGSSFATAKQELIDEWFRSTYRLVSGALQQYMGANDQKISYETFSSGSYYKDMGPADFLNQTLIYNGQVDKTVLSVTVTSDAVLNGMKLPIDAGWARDYELVIFTFPDAVNVTLSGAPQSIYNSQMSNSHWPDGYVDAATVAERDALCANVIYSFPNARSISITGVQLFGSILAPDANVSLNGGQINGQLVCNDFTTQNAGELHARRINRKAFEILDEEEGLGTVTLRKYLHYRVDTQVPLEGAVYRLFVYGTGSSSWAPYNSEQYTTDADGSLTIEELPYGTYRLLEVEAPPGFDLDGQTIHSALEFYLDAENSSQALELTAYNEPLYTALAFTKLNEKRDPLAGAQFQLVRLPDEYDFFTEQGITFSATSDAAGAVRFTGLPMGSYVLKELVAPDGYELMEDISFDIVYNSASQGLEAVLSGTGDPLSTLLGDALELVNSGGWDNALTVFKYNGAAQDVEAARGLEGAEFALYRLVGGRWERWEENGAPAVIVTDAAGYGRIEGLPDGEYRLVETLPPDGFLAGNPLDDGQDPSPYAAQLALGGTEHQVGLVQVANTPLYTGLTLQKIGEVAGVQSPLPGASFSLYRLDETDGEVLVARQTTGPDGNIRFTGLYQGSYLLRETAATGYQPLAGDISIQIAFDDDGTPIIRVDAGLNRGLVSYDSDSQTVEVVNLAYTGSLTLYKMDRERFQNGTDWDEDTSYTITYLEGAVFQLLRREHGFYGDYLPFGGEFASSYGGYGTDRWGNQLAGAFIDGLPWGDYHIQEISAPAGYRVGSQSGIVGEFSITEGMAQAQVHVELDISNVSDNALGPIRIRKVDRANPSQGIEGVEFKLWRIDDSIFPLSGREHIDQVMPYLARYGQQKYAYEQPLVTDDDGWISLELEPGLYLLFEYEPAAGYLYTLERGQTLERATDPSFYHYSYLFKVVEMPDPAHGVRIQWVDRYKLLDGEVVGFNPDVNDLDNDRWNLDGSLEEAAYTTFAITNRKVEDLVATVILQKLDENKEGLAGAVFTLSRAERKEEENPVYQDSDFQVLGTYSSGSDGVVELSQLGEGYYRLEETTAPAGYALLEQPIFFRLQVDGYAKVLDFYDENGVRQAGYREPDSVTGIPAFVTSFSLGERMDYPLDTPVGSLTLRKVDARDQDTGLAGAEFSLYVWVENDWTLLRDDLPTGEDGLLTIGDLPAGDYKLVETAPPMGYQDEGLELLFTMAEEKDSVLPVRGETGWDSDGRLVAENTLEEEPVPLTGSLTLRKVDGENEDTGLSGAKFALYMWENEDWSELRTGLITGEGGILTISDLPAGDYKLVETAPPIGYQDEGLELLFTMAEEKDSVLPVRGETGWDSDGRLVAENTAEKEPEPLTGSLTLRKVDEENEDTGLSGAVFTLYMWENEDWSELRTSLITGEDGILIIPDLPAGSYRLVETAAPTGYLLGNLELFFTMVEEKDSVFPETNPTGWDGEGRLVARNTRDTASTEDPEGDITLQKIDAETGVGLEGAVFALYLLHEEEDILLQSGLRSGQDGLLSIKGLEPGSYRLTETAPPDGYLDQSVSILFEMVRSDGRVVAWTQEDRWSREGYLQIPNHREEDPEDPRGELVIEKVDAENGAALPGAVFDLYLDGELLRAGLTTGADGRLVITGLRPGDYSLREVLSPPGYSLNGNPTEFEMVLHNDLVAPGFSLDGDGEDAWLLYRWENPTEDDGERNAGSQEPPDDGVEPEEGPDEEPEPGQEPEEPDDNGKPDPDEEEDPDDPDDRDDEKDPDEKEPDEKDPDEKEEDKDDSDDESGGGEPGEEVNAYHTILQTTVPLESQGATAKGEWVLVSLTAYHTDADGLLQLGSLDAGSYKLVGADPDSEAPTRFFSLGEETDNYTLQMQTAHGQELLRVENHKKPSEPESGGSDSSGGGGRGRGRGNGSEYREPERNPAPTPSTPETPDVSGDSGSSGGAVSGDGYGPNNNPGTGALGGNALLAWGAGMAAAGGALAGRKSIRWWLRGLLDKKS